MPENPMLPIVLTSIILYLSATCANITEIALIKTIIKKLCHFFRLSSFLNSPHIFAKRYVIPMVDIKKQESPTMMPINSSRFMLDLNTGFSS